VSASDIGQLMLGAGVIVMLCLAVVFIFQGLNGELRSPPAPAKPSRLARFGTDDWLNLLSALAVMVVFGSCATCGVVQSCSRVDAYRACLERFTPDECVGSRP
jgi:hypothetical protein